MASDRKLKTELPVRTLPRWSVPDARRALVNHEIGQFGDSALLAEAMTADARIRSALGTRVQSVTGLPCRFETESDDPRAKEAAEIAEQKWREWIPEGDSEALHRWLLLMGFGLGQNLWDRSGRLWMPRLNVWHPTYLYWYWNVESKLGKWQLIVADGGAIEPANGDGQWVFPKQGQKRPWMNGLVRSLAYPWSARQYAFQDWARYSERHGMPILKAIIPAGANDELIDPFIDDLRNLGSEGLLPLRQGEAGNVFDLQLLEATANTHEAFPGLIEQANTDIALAVLGQNLTSEVQGGSLAAARVHGDVRQDLLEADAKLMASTWNESVFRPWARVNYGSDRFAPRLVYVVEPPADKEKEANTLNILGSALQMLQAARAPVDIRAVLERAEVPLLDEGEEEDLPLPNEEPGVEASDPVALSSVYRRSQGYLDRLTVAPLRAARRAVASDIDTVLAAIEKVPALPAGKPDAAAIEAELTRVLSAMDPARLASVIQAPRLRAHLYGRLELK